ncbi:DoxX family membrane protein [Enterobacter cloacae]|uniref:DoxX family membrane protein n=1 Tax=Enterobacter cloacae TaxID=550 RepID=UPI00148287D9|nr:DoxX family membrane protein [Enterobacter cloacae]MDW3563483.1 DoxX family membrane protein [Enterobacter cloacae]WNJ09265.1 DoxX family membrane protein [Enterobacter cloacae]
MTLSSLMLNKNVHRVLPFTQVSIACVIVVELACSLMLATGIKSRLIVTLLVGFAIITGLVFHNALSEQKQLIQFLQNIAMAGGLLQITAFGPNFFILKN